MPPPMVLIGAGIKAAGSMFVAASLIMLPVVGIILMINVTFADTIVVITTY